MCVFDRNSGGEENVTYFPYVQPWEITEGIVLRGKFALQFFRQVRKADSRACWWSARANTSTIPTQCSRALWTQNRYYLPSFSDIYCVQNFSGYHHIYWGGSKLEKKVRRNLWSPFTILVIKSVFGGHLVFFTIHCMLRYSQAILTMMIEKDFVLTLLILIKLLVFKFHMEAPCISWIIGRTYKGVCNSLLDTVL